MTKIVYCAHSKIPSREANSIHVMKMCQALAKQGLDVELVVPNLQTEKGNPFVFYGVDNIFRVKYIKWSRIKLGVFFYSFRVLRYLLKNKKDGIYGRDLTSCFVTSSYGIPTIWESHSPVDYMGFPYVYLFKRMVKRKSFVKLVVITSTLKQFYIDKYCISPDKIVVLPDCSDALDISKISPIHIKSNDYKANVGYIGQLYPGKGMEILSKLIPHCPDVMFHIIGGNEKDTQKWKENLKGIQNVIFHGFKKPSETASYGLAMDILIAPYMRNVQGAGSSFECDLSNWMSPLKLFEYMSYKKPIIATDLPVLHDILNENNSIMCNPDSISEWVDAVYRLVVNSEEAKRIANNAFNDFNEKYTWNIRAEKIKELYRNCFIK